jgi:hypothetical protein
MAQYNENNEDNDKCCINKVLVICLVMKASNYKIISPEIEMCRQLSA